MAELPPTSGSGNTFANGYTGAEVMALVRERDALREAVERVLRLRADSDGHLLIFNIQVREILERAVRA